MALASTKSTFGSAGPENGGLAALFQDAVKRFSQLGPAFLRRTSAYREARSRRLIMDIRREASELDLTSWSDLQLKGAIGEVRQSLNDNSLEGKWKDHRSHVFAIVDESIRRRLGPFRLLEPGTDRGHFEKYWNVASGLEESRTLDANGLAIVDAMMQVREGGWGRFGADLLLPASFYRAVALLDTDNRFIFRPTDQQLMAGLHLLDDKVVDMKAGEGKTVAIAFAAAMHAILGRPVHVMTANDYLAERDCRLLAPFFRSLGLSVGAILEPLEKSERRETYGCDVVYGTLREFGFDYLRDNMVYDLGDQVCRGRQVAIIDEADQALIDEADAPLIIAGPPARVSHSWKRVNGVVSAMVADQEALAEEYADAAQRDLQLEHAPGTNLVLGLLACPKHPGLRHLALENPKSYRRGVATVFPCGDEAPDEQLLAGHHYTVDPQRKYVTLTSRGIEHLEDRLGKLFLEASGVTSGPFAEGTMSQRTARNLDLVSQVYQSLRAHLILEKGVDYLVSDSSVVLLDQYTGRLKPDSVYQDGLQTALAAKEGVDLESAADSLGRISVQGFVSHYRSLSGITGTALGADDDFLSRYSLEPVAVPAAARLQRVDLPSRIYADNSAKLDALVEEVTQCRMLGRPVLVGVQTVEQSLAVSRLLREKGLEHRLLNASHTQEEADIVRRAGSFGAITVATNMAGRGTDIVLDAELESQLLDRCLEAVLGKLDTGTPAVRVTCNTAGEAALLQDAFGSCDARDLRIQWKRGENAVVVGPSAADQQVAAKTDGFSELEFGLGLHLISAEFNRFPRVAVQLKGRSGRQGSFGSTRCLLSWDDTWLLNLGQKHPRLKDALRQDPAGRLYFEGPGVERFIKLRQDAAESEAAHRRSIVNDYAAVMDAHTESFYRARQRLLEKGFPPDRLVEITLGASSRLVYQYYPRLDPVHYLTQFAALKHEAMERYGIDVAFLEGTPLDQMASAIAGVLARAVDEVSEHLGDRRFEELGSQMYLECADEAWQEHQSALRAMVFASVTGSYGHKSAVADYIARAADRWEQLWGAVEDDFLSGILTFPALDPEESRPQLWANIEFGKEAALLLS